MTSSSGSSRPPTGRIDVALAQELGIAEQNSPALDLSDHTLAEVTKDTVMTKRNEPTRHSISQPLNGRAAPLCLGHHLDDAGEHRVTANPVRPHEEASRAPHRAADHFCSHSLVDRHGLAGDHGLIDCPSTLDDRPSTRAFSPGRTRRLSSTFTASSATDRKPR